ncbi:MAG: hypothetical protein GY811_28415 [Myxococcales bacterium]|nr:hypothetical protein [Myxococcales bacterium]
MKKLASCVSTAIPVPWHLVFPTLMAGVRFERVFADSSPLMRSAAATRLTSEVAPALGEMDLVVPEPVRGEEESFADTVTTWLLDSLVPTSWR